MEVLSAAFEEGKIIPRKHTCQGVGTSPPLEISGVPAQAKSLALIMDDPDVPPEVRADRMYVHWVAYNIDPSTVEIVEGTPTLGTQGRNTNGENRYIGPCPPDREHRYFFKLYALDCELPLHEGATKEEVLAAMEGHVLEQCELMGRYEQT